MKAKHIHQYKRVNLRADKTAAPYYVFKCQRALCSHYLPMDLVEGKLSECPRCDNPFKLEKHHLQLVVPHCDNCKVTRQ